jgi:hypothetical protein
VPGRRQGGRHAEGRGFSLDQTGDDPHALEREHDSPAGLSRTRHRRSRPAQRRVHGVAESAREPIQARTVLCAHGPASGVLRRRQQRLLRGVGTEGSEIHAFGAAAAAAKARHRLRKLRDLTRAAHRCARCARRIGGKAADLPIQSHLPKAGGGGDLVVGDVVDLEGAGGDVAQHHVGGVAAEKVAEADIFPVGSNLTEIVARQDGVVADVVNLVLAHRARCAQNHIGGCAGGRRRVRHRREEEAVVVVGRIGVRPDDLARHVDPVGKGAGGRGIVDRGEEAAAVEKPVVPRMPIEIRADDLARIVDARCKGAADAQGIVDGGVGTVAVEKAMDATGVIVLTDDLARCVDAEQGGGAGPGNVNRGVRAAA